MAHGPSLPFGSFGDISYVFNEDAGGSTSHGGLHVENDENEMFLTTMMN